MGAANVREIALSAPCWERILQVDGQVEKVEEGLFSHLSKTDEPPSRSENMAHPQYPFSSPTCFCISSAHLSHCTGCKEESPSVCWWFIFFLDNLTHLVGKGAFRLTGSGGQTTYVLIPHS